MFVVLFAFLSGPVFATGDAVSKFNEGNKAYAEGRWAKAAELYRGAVDAGMNNAVVWYNLGCAAWKTGSPGMSVLYFERALRMNPGDADIKNNLRFVTAHLAEQPAPEEGFAAFILSFMTLNELLVVLLIIVWAFFIMLALYLRLRKEPLAWFAGILFLLMLVSGVSSGLILYDRVNTPRAVVLPARVEVYSGPGRDYTSGGSLTEGSIVKLFRTQEDWAEIGFKDRYKGWVRTEEVEKI